MARKHGILKTTVWDVGSDFRQLTLPAQWAYTMLLSQPQINNCGVLPHSPERWTKLAAGLTRRDLQRALNELDARNFIVVDTETDEVLVRSFIKHDGIWKVPNLIIAARREYKAIYSPRIRTLLVTRHPWITDEQADPAHIKTYEENYRAPDPHPEPDPEPLPKPHPEPVPRARTHAHSPAPTPTPTPLRRDERSAATPPEEEPQLQNAAPNREEQDHPAAADGGTVTDTEILDACRRFGADRDVVFPLAEQLPAAVFAGVAGKVAIKTSAGGVRDVPALFVDLLKRAGRELEREERAGAGRVAVVSAAVEAATPVRESVSAAGWVEEAVPVMAAGGASAEHVARQVAFVLEGRGDVEGEELAGLIRRAGELFRAAATAKGEAA